MKKQTICAVLALTPTLGMFAHAAFSQDKSRDLIKPPEVSIQVNTVAFSPDSRFLAAGCTRDAQGETVIWEMKTKKVVALHRAEKGIHSVAFSPDSKTLAVGSLTENCFVLDAQSGKAKATLPGHGEAARSVAFSPDGKTLAVGGYDGKIRLWDYQAEKLLLSWEAHAKKRIIGLAYSPDGSTLVSVPSPSGEIGVWAAGNGKQLRAWKDSVSRVAFERQGKWIAIGSTDLKIRELNSDREVNIIAATGSLSSVNVHPSGNTIAMTKTFSTSVQVFPLVFREATAAEQKRIQNLIAKWEDDSLDVREKASEEIQTFGLLAEPLLLKAMKDGPSAECRMRARIAWSTLKTPKAAHALEGHREPPLGCAYSDDGQWLASIGRDPFVFLWDTATYQLATKLIWPKKRHSLQALEAWFPYSRFRSLGTRDNSA